MKFWEDILRKNLTFEKAQELAKADRYRYITRPEWDGIHFYDKKHRYCILLKNGTVIVDVFDKAQDKDKDDWMLVSINDEALKILEEKLLI